MSNDASDEDDVLKGYDLDAWEAPPVPADLADAVLARLGGTEVGAAVPVETTGPRRRVWLVAGVAAARARGDGGNVCGDPIDASRGTGEWRGARGTRADALDSSGVTADLDPRRRCAVDARGHAVRVEQRAGTAAWRVDGDSKLVIDAGAMVASVEATGASLRVEVQMNAMDGRVIGASALTAAAVAMVTVVVYEGHVKVSHAGQHTVIVQPGATYQVTPPPPPPVPTTPVVVGTPVEPAPVPVESKGPALDRQMISDAIAKAQPEFAACGEKFPATGKVKLAMKVTPFGKVANVEVTETPTAELAHCLVQVMVGVKFPATDTGGSFSYPFVF